MLTPDILFSWLLHRMCCVRMELTKPSVVTARVTVLSGAASLDHINTSRKVNEGGLRKRGKLL
jgi:uncharacterized protein (UPF0548 family)